MIEDYFDTFANLLRSNPFVRAHDVTFDKRGPDLGYLRGNIFFSDGSLLHFREMVATALNVDRFSYTYHYQKADGTFVFRYDNSEHYPGLANFPHHKHTGDTGGVSSAVPPDLAAVLKEIEAHISIP